MVVSLFFFGGLTYREIAEVSDCPIGTVMSRLARGRQALRRALAPHVVPGDHEAESEATGAYTPSPEASRGS